MKTVLALDLSLQNCGWAVYGEQGLASGLASFIKAPKGKEPPYRFILYRDWLRELLAIHAPGQVVFENAVARFGERDSLIGLKIITQMECAARDLPCRGVYPSSLKKAATGNGRATKEQMQQIALVTFPHYDPTKDKGSDEADALCLLNSVLKGLV